MDWNAIALGLEAAAENAGVDAYDYVPDDLPNTGFYVGEMEMEPNQTFGRRVGGRTGMDQGTITCRLLVARFDDKSAIRKMRKFMAGSGANSVIQAIQADRTLGGSCDDSKVSRISGNRLFTVGEVKFYGFEIDIFVIGAA